MTDSPLIRVLLPVHNGMPYLPETVQSLRVQSFKDFEVLVLDDGSTDETPQYVRSIDDPRFRHIRLDRVRLPAALNHGIELATSPLLVRIDADDIAYPERLARQFDFMERNPGCVLAGCDYERIDSAGNVIGAHKSVSADAAIRYQMLFTTPFLHPGVIMRRDAVVAAGAYNTEFRVAQDYELWTRVAFQGQLGNVPQVLMQYRSNEQGASAKNRSTQVANASQSAAAYAERLQIGIQKGDWLRLHEFIVCGNVDDNQSPRGLVDCFALAAKHFRGLCSACIAEFERVYREFRDILRWRLSEQIQQRKQRGLSTLDWHAARFRMRPNSREILRRLVGKR